MRFVFLVVAGLLVGVVYVLLVGLLNAQLIGQKAGARMDLNNVIVELTNPKVPVFPMLGIVAASGLVLWFVTTGSWSEQNTRSNILACSVGGTILALIGLSFVLTPAGNGVDNLVEGLTHGWKGWLELAGSNSAVHVTCLVALGSLSVRRFRDDAASSPVKR
ncbi:hypothetical protein VR010_02375 [Actinomycetaceae bacterium L2_0104]